MATISCTTPTSTILRATAALPKSGGLASSSVIGLPQFGMRGGRVRCSSSKDDKPSAAAAIGAGAGASLLAAASMAGPALALVDERLSTEGTGLSLGISNNLLGWILLGVFGLIWALFFVYTSTLEEDEESGLSL
ncbi:photosystem II reaction center W protein, chloroplastic-like [Typha latifolia]|uniref:photosystem II reaction center W protein, chloroplastic-like n=1 Tax=Typha latifolia TaxID=4733 RepID=UPI003C2D2C8F